MRTLLIAVEQGTGDSTPVEVNSTPFSRGREVVVAIAINHQGSGSGREWEVQGNNQPAGDTPVWETLAGPYGATPGGFDTIEMPHQIRLSSTAAGSGSKTCSATLIGD